MTELNLEQVKTIQVDILKALHAFCKKQNIRYYLASGTLIGAIRHNGYIPWDDDIDVYMPRPDYDTFLATFNRQSPRYQVKSLELDPDFPFPYAKVFDTNTLLKEHTRIQYTLNINIDLFPLDGIDEADRFLLKLQHFLNLVQQFKIMPYDKRRGIIKNTILYSIRLALSPITSQFIIKRMIQNARKYPYDRCKKVAVLCEGVKNNYIYDKSVFSGDETHLFEDGMFYIPKGYKEYLTKAYGDFMQLPPAEKRTTHHNFEAYIKED